MIAILLPTLYGISTAQSSQKLPTKQRFSFRKALNLNRIYLAIRQHQLALYKNQISDTGDSEANRQMEYMQNQILVFEQESQRLRSGMSEHSLSREFLRDVLIGKRIQKIYETRSIFEAAQWLGTNPNSDLHEKALALVEAGDMKSAVPIYQEIILRNPDDDQACIILGHIYLMSGEYSNAEVAFQNAIHIDPGNIYEITPLYENMLMQNPYDDTAYANLGYVYMMAGNYLKAKECFGNSVSINPTNERASMGMAMIKSKER